MNRRAFLATPLAWFAASAGATAVSVPQFAEGASVTARPVIVTKAEILSAGLVAVLDGNSQPVMDSWGGVKQWIEIVTVIPSNEIDLQTGLAKPDTVIKQTYTGPFDQGVYLKGERRGVRHPDTVTQGAIVYE